MTHWSYKGFFGKKIFRGNIYFYNGCKKSKASEGEFSILLDDTIESHAIPAMLCDEDDVVGLSCHPLVKLMRIDYLSYESWI